MVLHIAFLSRATSQEGTNNLPAFGDTEVLNRVLHVLFEAIRVCRSIYCLPVDLFSPGVSMGIVRSTPRRSWCSCPGGPFEISDF